MAGRLPHRSGVLVVRVWHEDASAEDRFRARILYTADPDDAEQAADVVGSAAEVLALVSSWLESFRTPTR